MTLGEILFSADPVWLRLPGLEFTELQGYIEEGRLKFTLVLALV